MAMGACNPPGCNPPVPPGDLTFSLPGAGNVIVSKNTIGTNNAWGTPALGTALTQQTSLDPSSPFVDMEITYKTTPAISTNQLYRQEVDIFASDPADYLNSITGLLNDTGSWAALTDPCALPDALILPYPSLNGTAQWGPPTLSSTFFSNCNGPINPAIAGPLGFGSVRAAYEADRGFCSARAYYDQVVPLMQAQMLQQFGDKVGASGCADAEQLWFYETGYLNENQSLDPDLAPTGGFLVNFYFDAHIHIPSVHDLNMRFNYQYPLALADGILTTGTPVENGVDVNGAGGLSPVSASQSQSSFEDALNTQVPSGINMGALALQSVDPFQPCCPGTSGDTCETDTSPVVADCDPSGFPSSDTNAEVPVDSGQCLAAINYFQGAVATAQNDGTLQSLGISPTAQNPVSHLTAEDVLINTIHQTDPADPTLLHNWRCVAQPDGKALPQEQGPGHARCEYVVRARRLNFYADSFDLVWTDNPAVEVAEAMASTQPVSGPATGVPPWTSSGVPIFIIALDQAQHPRSSSCATLAPPPPMGAYQALCNVPPNQATRSFYFANAGDQTVNSSGVFSCSVTVLESLLKTLFTGTGLAVSIATSLYGASAGPILLNSSGFHIY
jgi:hypothetical protein